MPPASTRACANSSAPSPSEGRFTDLWNTHTVRGKTQEAKNLSHPDVGPLTLTYQAFDVRDAPGQQLIVYQAEPGSPSAQASTFSAQSMPPGARPSLVRAHSDRPLPRKPARCWPIFHLDGLLRGKSPV
jgi:hypothetical protein